MSDLDRELGAYLLRRTTELEDALVRSYAGHVTDATRKWVRSVARRLAEDEVRELARERRRELAGGRP